MLVGKKIVLNFIIFICFPILGIIKNICTNIMQFFFIADNMFVIIPLPDGIARGILVFVDAFGGGGFKSRNK